MAPTRRDLLKASAGLVAASLASVPAKTTSSKQPMGLYIDMTGATSLADMRLYLVEDDSTRADLLALLRDAGVA